MFLKSGFIVNEKYEIIKVVKTTGSTICYTAKKVGTDEKVFLKEFFSLSIMRREDDGNVKCLQGKDVQYKSLIMDYEELNHFTMSLNETEALITPFDVFSTNGTCYSVEPIIDIVTLEEHLAANHGALSWQKVKKLVAPLITVLRKMHNSGIYHRGISPETIMVTSDQRFLLSGFEIPAARTADSEIEAKLYFAYSAPEQYSSASWQGNWTDVYSLAAVCYRSLTGFSPVEWRQRDGKRQLLTANSVDSTIPENVSNAIMTALSVDIRNRYRTIDEFWASLLHGPGDTAVIVTSPRSPVKTSIPLPVQEEEKSFNTKLMMASVGLLVILVVFNVAAWVNRMPSKATTPITESSTSIVEKEPEDELELIVPDLIGSSVERVLLDKMYTQFFEFDVKKEYSDTVVSGVVIRQMPYAGVKVDNKNELITLYISNGSQRVYMPQILDLPIEEASIILNSKEIPFVITEEITEEKAPGFVIWSSIENGTIVNRSADRVEIKVSRQAISKGVAEE